MTEKVFIRCCSIFGPEYGGRVGVVIRAIYGIKTAAASFQQHLKDCMDFLGFEPCVADPNVFYKPFTRVYTGVQTELYG